MPVEGCQFSGFNIRGINRLKRFVYSLLSGLMMASISEIIADVYVFFDLLVSIDSMTFSNHFFVVVRSQVWLLPFVSYVLLEKVDLAVDRLVSEVQLLRFFVQIQQQQLLGGDYR